jgi:hypothetical protein
MGIGTGSKIHQVIHQTATEAVVAIGVVDPIFCNQKNKIRADKGPNNRLTCRIDEGIKI